MRDRTVGETFFMFFTTRAFATGIPTVLAGTPVVSAYEDASITQITAGITLGVDHDGVVGLNLLTLVATGANGFEAGKDYSMVITTGTVGGVSVVGEVVGEFSLGLSAGFTRLGAPAGVSVSVDIADVPTVAEFDARTILAAAYFDPAADAVANVTLVATTTTNTDMRGTDSAATAAALATVDSNVDSILVDTAEIGVAGAGLTDITLNAASIDLVWDEVLTAATHNIVNSAGRRLRTIPTTVIRENTAQGSGTGNNQIQLDTSASSIDGTFDPSIIVLINGTGGGQTRLILQYEGATKTATVDRNWKVNPDSTTEFIIVGYPGREHVNEGLITAGTASTVTLNILASSNDDVYNGQTIFIRSGTGEDQARIVTDYNGTTKVATVGRNWDVIPDTTSGYVMLPQGDLPGIDAKVDIIQTDTTTDIPAQITALNNLSAAEILTTQLTEAYAADGVAPTLSQLLFLVQQTLGDFGIAGTTLTVRKIDGATTAATFTLDDGTNPTDITRAT